MAGDINLTAEQQNDLEKVKTQSKAKLDRHKLDDYLAIILGCGSCLVLWIFQLMGFY